MQSQGEGRKPSPYRVRGPAYDDSPEEGMYRDFAQVWHDGSLQLARLANANGFLYFHFLQPNQYWPDSKIMSRAERRIAIHPRQAYARGVVAGYPWLKSAGVELVEQGVAFHDLTMMFADEDEPLYIDSCCHLSPRGMERVGERIGQLIRSDLVVEERSDR